MQTFYPATALFAQTKKLPETGARQMAQWLTTLTALAKEQDLVPGHL